MPTEMLTEQAIANIRFDLANTKPTSSPTGLFRQHCEDLLSERDDLQSQLEQLRAENERLTKDNADLVAANLGSLLSEIKGRLTLEEGEEFQSLLMTATRGWVDEVTERTAVDRGLLEAFKDMPKKKRRH